MTDSDDTTRSTTGGEPGGRTDAVPDDAATAPSLLLLAEDGDDGEHAVCLDLLTAGGSTDTVLTVSLDESPGRQLAKWERENVPRPENFVLLAVGGWEGVDVPADVHTETITNHRDLPRLGIKLTDLVSEHVEETDGGLAVCFDSLTTLLQYLDAELVFRFIHTFQSRIASYDVRVHYHLDPTRVEQETVMTLRVLFDTVLELDGGEFRVEQD